MDAHVGKAVFHNVLQDPPPHKTRILVTHALHFLPQVDYIYTIADGKIAEWGTYEQLMKNDGAFSKFFKEFGGKEEQQEEEEKEEELDAIEAEKKDSDDKKRKNAVKGTAMMQNEERNTGSISGAVYKEYLKAGKGVIVIPVLALSLVLVQGASVMSSYW